MAPTMEVGSGTSSSTDWTSVSDNHSKESTWDHSDLSLSLEDYSSTCQTYFTCRDLTHSVKSTIPEASPVFKETLDKMKLEHTQNFCKKANDIVDNDAAIPRPTSSPPPSFLTKLKSAFKSSSSSISPHPSPNKSQGLPFLTTSTSKSASSRRPASFGGSDGVKPSTERRASNCEKRVSWADERGSDHPLFSVRLIRPRLSTDPNPGALSPPGTSILRNTGIL